MKRQLFESPHNEIAYTLNHLSSLKQDLGHYLEAIPFAEESYRQRIQIYGPVHLETIASQSNLGRIYRSLGEYSLALPLYEDVLAKLDQIFPDGHPYTGATYQSLADIHMKTGDIITAEDYYRQALDIDEKLLDADDMHRSYAMVGLGRLLTHSGRPDEAEALLEAALRMRQKNLPEGHFLIGICQQALGECLLAGKDYEEGVRYLNGALETFKTMPGKYRSNIESIVDQLIDTHRRTGTPEHIDRYRQFLTSLSG
jgi:serine/threonine-protein kinase